MKYTEAVLPNNFSKGTKMQKIYEGIDKSLAEFKTSSADCILIDPEGVKLATMHSRLKKRINDNNYPMRVVFRGQNLYVVKVKNV